MSYLEYCAICRAPASPETERRGVDGDVLPLDFCAICGENLCPACMERGHCGYSPARSGAQEGYLGGSEAE